MARIIDGAEMNLIGSNLKRLRQERGWSQQLLPTNWKQSRSIFAAVQFPESKTNKELSLILSFTGWPMFGRCITDLFE